MAGTCEAWAVTFVRCCAALLGVRFAGLVPAQTTWPQTNEIASGPLSRKVTREDRKGIEALFAAGG
jgi:hypothetical protein